MTEWLKPLIGYFPEMICTEGVLKAFFHRTCTKFSPFGPIILWERKLTVYTFKFLPDLSANLTLLTISCLKKISLGFSHITGFPPNLLDIILFC